MLTVGTVEAVVGSAVRIGVQPVDGPVDLAPIAHRPPVAGIDAGSRSTGGGCFTETQKGRRHAARRTRLDQEVPNDRMLKSRAKRKPAARIQPSRREVPPGEMTAAAGSARKVRGPYR